MVLENVYMGTSPMTWGENKKIKYITMSITDECNLRCTYCYFTHKTDKNIMTFDIAKKAVDEILNNKENLNFDGAVWEFIGGEPTIEMELIDKISDYIVYKMYSLNHKWFLCYHFMIGSNGLLYKSKKVQSYIKKHGLNLYIAITIDGTQEKHDLSRIKKDGTGSYSDIIRNIPLWKKQFNAYTTKATFSHADLPYLKDSIIHLWKLGIQNIAANVVYENVWEPGDVEIFKNQLYQLADYVIKEDLWDKYSVRFFDPINGTALDDYQTRINYCGSGKMLAINTNGDYYPCVRFMPSAMNNHSFQKIGDIYSGIDPDRLRSFSALSLLNQSPQKCLDCDIAGGCSWCSGLNFDCSSIGTIFERKTYMCEFHKATVEVNKYLWRQYELIKKRISPFRYRKLTTISNYNKYLYIYGNSQFPSLCGYIPQKDYGKCMSDKTLEKVIEFCESNNYVPIFCGFQTLPDNYYGYQIILYSEYKKQAIKTHPNYFTFILAFEEEIDKNFSMPESILNLTILVKPISESLIRLIKKIDQLSNKFAELNINISFTFPTEYNSNFIKDYSSFLNKLAKLIFKKWEEKNYININLLTNELFANSNRNCGAGRTSLSVSPEGKVYLCPAFYYNDKKDYIGSVDENDFSNKFFSTCNMDVAPLCADCSIKHCERCIFKNKTRTGELIIPSEIQCLISHLEYKYSYKLNSMLQKIQLPFEIHQKLKNISFYDPLESIRGKDYIKHDFLNLNPLV